MQMDPQCVLEQTHNPALMHPHKCPADVATILIMKMGLINVEIAPRALNAKEYRLKALLTALFPGMTNPSATLRQVATQKDPKTVTPCFLLGSLQIHNFIFTRGSIFDMIQAVQACS